MRKRGNSGGPKSGKKGVFSHKNPPFYPWVSDVEEVALRIGPGARIKITRLAPGTPHYLTTVYAQDFSLQWLLDTFGGGDYYARVFDGARYVQSFKLYLDPSVPSRG